MSSGFVSSSEIADEKKRVQEEWERVRKPDDPITAPEAEVCDKSLFEQLKINRDKKQVEMEEAKKFKNLVRGIDEDESEFLAEVNSAKHAEYLRKNQEEKEMLKEMAVAQVKSTAEKPISSLKPSTSTPPQKSKQAALLGSIVKRKNDSKTEDPNTSKQPKTETGPALKVIAGIPGISDYVASSDSESSESSDDDVPTVKMLKKSAGKCKKS